MIPEIELRIQIKELNRANRILLISLVGSIITLILVLFYVNDLHTRINKVNAETNRTISLLESKLASNNEMKNKIVKAIKEERKGSTELAEWIADIIIKESR